jgi:adenosine deaminase
MRKTPTFFAALVAGLAACWPACFGQTTGIPAPAEARAAKAFEAVKKLGTGDLYAFLKPMPKGAELHYHLGGGIYAETTLDEAVRQGICIDPVAVRFAASGGRGAPCVAGTIPAAEAVKDEKLYTKLVDVMSMRSFVAFNDYTGHDQFFSGFRAGGPTGFLAEWLAEVATRAADQNEIYLEIMTSPTFRAPAALGASLPWPADAGTSVTREELAKIRDQLIAAGLFKEIDAGRKEMDDAEAAQRAIEKCSGKVAADSPCNIKMHYIFTISRGAAPMQVFAQALLGFQLNSVDPRFVGINIAAPEDGRVSMKDYHMHMQMLDYLHSLYPKVNLTLHAGELAPGLVPPEGLRFHIREAMELGHAQRIGHGVDVLYEDDAAGLLREMAAKHISVEINLTSNDVILGVKGRDHPLSGYIAAHVPVSLSTDDEGNSRIDLTHEYVKGAEEQGLDYMELKKMARTSFEHSFLYGESLWVAQDDFTRRKPACGEVITATSVPTAACAALLKGSEKAAAQWELERRYAVFEASIR